jgi:hypothetical protein
MKAFGGEKLLILKNKHILSLVIGIVVLIPINRGSAAIIWSEEFEDLNDWDLYEWEDFDAQTSKATNPTDPKFTIVDGALTNPNDQLLVARNAIHDSSVAYGTWSFDWYISPEPEHDSALILWFIHTDLKYNYNMTGVSGPQYARHLMSYGLAFISSSKVLESAPEAKDLYAAPGITLMKYENDFEVLKKTKFKSPISGMHKIVITRNLKGEFKVYINLQLSLQGTDNSTSTSEKFCLWPVIGDALIDNITVKDDLLPPPPIASSISFPTLVTFMSVGVLIIMRRKKEKGTSNHHYLRSS